MTEEINKELEEKLNELFPKLDKSCDLKLMNEFIEIVHKNYYSPYDSSDDFGQKVVDFIKKIQAESGRDRALVLFALAKKRIIELEEELKVLREKVSKHLDL